MIDCSDLYAQVNVKACIGVYGNDFDAVNTFGLSPCRKYKVEKYDGKTFKIANDNNNYDINLFFTYKRKK